MLNGRREARERARQVAVVERSERTIAELLVKARLRHAHEPTPYSGQEVEELEHQHKLARDLLEQLRTTAAR